MKKNITIIITILILVMGSLFYWYEYRPTKIRKYCNAEALNTNTGSLGEFLSVQENYDNNYKKCLRDNGLEK